MSRFEEVSRSSTVRFSLCDTFNSEFSIDTVSNIWSNIALKMTRYRTFKDTYLTETNSQLSAPSSPMFLGSHNSR